MASPDASPPPRLVSCFAGETASPPPIWLMRQAGRYLPEYRALRATVSSFLDLCYTPALAAELALQPIRRFGFDAAILFSDILVVPDALGQTVAFIEGEGPRLEPIRTPRELLRLRPDATRSKFARVCEAVARLRQQLPRDTALIGFCGAPWTVASYMVQGGGSPDQAAARCFAYRDAEGFERLIALLIDTSVGYLCDQVAAGADVLQIFDSWAGGLADDAFERWVIAPTRAIVDAVRRRHPRVPVIGFPRGAGSRIGAYAAATGVAGVSCDTGVPLADMKALADAGGVVVQGNLDPVLLVVGGAAMTASVERLLAAMRGKPFICNLGHGVRPETPPAHVARLVQRVRAQG